MRWSIARPPVLLLVAALLLSACGGGDDVASDPTPTPPTASASASESSVKSEAEVDLPATPEATPTPAPAPTPTPAPTAAAPTTEPQSLTGRPASDDLAQAGADMGVSGESSYEGYTVITDDTGAIQVEVPTGWTDVDGRPYTDESGRQLFDVRASSDLVSFNDTWDTPGVIVTASREVAQSQDEVTLLDELVEPFSGVCTYLGREPYDDGLYTGFADVFDSCGGTDTGYIVVGAVPESRAFVIRVQVQVVAERDLEALQRALDSYINTGDV